MAEVVVNSTSKMSDADVRAIAVYLKSLPPGAPEPTVTPPTEAEMDDGQGRSTPTTASPATRPTARARRGVYPPLNGNALLQSADPVLDAAHHPRRRADRDDAARAEHRDRCRAMRKQFTDQEIADVTNYIRNSWGNAAPVVTADQVAKARNAERQYLHR